MTVFDFVVVVCVLAVLALMFCVDLSWPRVVSWWKVERRFWRDRRTTDKWGAR